MKTSLEKKDGLSRKLSIVVPADKVSSTFDRVYKGLQKNANIKGFRKGKAPINMIKNLYGDRVKQDVLEDLISEAYSHALHEHSLRPASQPTVNFEKIDEATPFHFTAEFEIRPEIVLKKTEKLKVEKEKLVVSEEKVDSILTQVRESRANLVPIFENRPAQSGDTVEIDFVGTVDGQPLDGGSMTGYKLLLGSNSFIPGFEDGLVGMTIGSQKELHLKFPDDYGHKEIAGKPVKFEVNLKALHKKDLPELNDEFVKSLGGYSSVEELKSAIRQDISEDENRRIYEDLKSRILKALVRENPVEVPQTLKAHQKEYLIADVEKRMKQQGLSEAELVEYKTKWDKDFDETAAFMIQTSFLIETIAEKNSLGATQKEVDERLARYAQQSGIEISKIREFYGHSRDRMNQIQYQITEEKVVNYLIEHADIKEVSADQLQKQ